MVKAFDASSPTSSAILEVDSGFLVPLSLGTKGLHKGSRFGGH